MNFRGSDEEIDFMHNSELRPITGKFRFLKQ